MADISRQLSEIERAVEVVRISSKPTENGQRNNSFFFPGKGLVLDPEKRKNINQAKPMITLRLVAAAFSREMLSLIFNQK